MITYPNLSCVVLRETTILPGMHCRVFFPDLGDASLSETSLYLYNDCPAIVTETDPNQRTVKVAITIGSEKRIEVILFPENLIFY